MSRNSLWLPVVGLMLLTGCFRLDGFLFNPDPPVPAYLLDGYTGESELEVGAAYDIPASLLHLFTVQSANGNTIHALYIGDTATIATDTVIVYCHGNRGHIDFYWSRAKLLSHTGGPQRFGVLIFDYQGYGLSEGTPAEQHLYDDTRAVVSWLRQRGLSDDRTVLYGYSMGSTAATEVMGDLAKDAGWLILEAPIASGSVLVQDGSLLALPASYVINLTIDVAEKVQDLTQPLLWMHGMADKTLAIETHGELIYRQSASTYKHGIRIQDCGHTEVPLKMQYDNYLLTMERFLTGAL